MSDLLTVKNEGEEIELSLEDIAGIDMGDVEEFNGFENLPAGIFDFAVKDAGLETVETKDGIKAVIFFSLEVEKVHVLVDDAIDPDSIIGSLHRETVWINDIEKGVGQAKAVMTNAGFTAKGKLEDLLDAFCGSKFTAPIKHTKNKNDPDIVYANLVTKKITPMLAE